MNTSLSFNTKQKIADKAYQFIEDNKLTQTKIAESTGINKSTITHIFKDNSDFTIPAGNGKVVTIADKYFERLANFIGLELNKTYWDNQATPQFLNIIANLQDAKQYGATNVIIGETGAGKTHCINLFARKNPADTYIVTVGSTDNLTDLIDKIIDEIKITTGNSKSKKLRDIARKLRTMKEDGLAPQLIFDEAEYMKQPALASMKELYDHLNKYCSIILIGTEQLLNNLDKMRKKNKPGIPQFYRRIKFGIRQLPAVDRSFKLFLNDIENPNTKKFVRKICDNYGELHDVIVPVKREAERTGEEITEGFIRKVLNLPAVMYV